MPRFANYIQDHMVLQRAPQRAVVWGYGDPEKLTILKLNNKIYTTISDAKSMNEQDESIWSITLNPVYDEGPFDIHVSQPLTNGTLVTITIHDVLFGDVWICSGQSNMQLTVSLIYNATEEIANVDKYPKIRVFTAADESSTTPIEDLRGIRLNWSVASPKNIGGPDWNYMSAVCWLYGRMTHVALGGRPIGLIATTVGGTPIELWMPPKALQDCEIPTDIDVIVKPFYSSSIEIPYNHSSLFNAMIYPFMRTVIYGVIWYQGEANRDYNTDKYACSFSKLIQYWRQMWHERTDAITDIQFPFGFVQLSTFANNSKFIGSYPAIRWHQTFDIGYVPNSVVPKVFMAVTLDLRDDPNGDHPRYKHDVGYRLSRSGLAIAYNQQIEFQGPIVQSVTYSIDSRIVNITYTAVSNIEVRNPNGFEVCCQGNKCSNDSSWIPVTISSKIALTITLTISSSCIGQQLYGLRYLWRETPCPFKQAAIYSYTDSNLPSPPYFKLFQTDKEDLKNNFFI
uniref:Cytosolic sialic acid 9-O-acetylesterase-like protein n=1 Tax=Adineta vaga TaxID=104782 RepID=D4NWE8_ADIVA|nr:cytosolic sialic acid 9-O-acetylesterase-like protein [Adineta vaga]